MQCVARRLTPHATLGERAYNCAYKSSKYLNYMGYMRLWSSLFPTTIPTFRYEEVADFEMQARPSCSASAWTGTPAVPRRHLASRYVGT